MTNKTLNKIFLLLRSRFMEIVVPMILSSLLVVTLCYYISSGSEVTHQEWSDMSVGLFLIWVALGVMFNTLVFKLSVYVAKQITDEDE